MRFPHLSVQIFQELDVQYLAKCKEVSGSWANLIETEKPLNDTFVIMRLIHGYWKTMPSCLMDWVENNIQFIRIKFKQKGINYNISYMRIIIPGYLKKLLICEQELKPKYAMAKHNRAVQNLHHTEPTTVIDKPLSFINFISLFKNRS